MRRITNSVEFSCVFNRCRVVRGAHVDVYYADAPGDELRFGVSVKKKAGTAVVRNRLKRLTREYMRLHAAEFKPASAIAVIHDGIRRTERDTEVLWTELDELLKCLKLRPAL